MKSFFQPVVKLTQAQVDAGDGNSLSGVRIAIVDTNSQPTGKVYESGPANSAPTEVVTGDNINTVMAAAGGAGWEKVQATTASYAITKPVSGAGLDLHIEAGGSLAALNSTVWPVPASGVDQLRIRNFSGSAKTLTAGTGWTIVTADGNPVTGGSYSIPDDRAVEITLDPDGFAQVVPWGGEVSQAALDAALALKANSTSLTDGSIQALLDTLRADSVHFLTSASSVDTLTTTGWYNIQNATGGPAGGGWYYYYHGTHRNTATGAPDTTYGFQLAKRLDSSTTNNLLMRVKTAGTWSAWATIAVSTDIIALSSTNPVMDGTAAVGTGTTSARTDHVHPSDTSRAIKTVSQVAATNALTSDHASWANLTMRQIVNNAGLTIPTGGTTRVRVTLEAHSTLATIIPAAFIGIKATSGDVFDYTATPVQLTFNGSTASQTIAAGQTLVSDWMNLAIAATDGLVIGIDMGVATNPQRQLATKSQWQSYYKSTSGDAATVNATGYLVDAGVTAVRQIEVSSTPEFAEPAHLHAQANVIALVTDLAAKASQTDLDLKAPLDSPVLTGTPQIGGNPKLGSNAGHAQRSFSDITGAAMAMVPATGTATSTIATSDVAARFVKPGTASAKANAVFDIVVGSHTAGLNGATQVDLRLANLATNVPDVTVMSLKGDGSVSMAGRFSSAFNGARVTRATDLAMANGATVSIPWDAETYDTNSYHDPATNNTRLTAPVAGYYRIGGNFVWPSNSTGFRALGYRVDAGADVWLSSPLPVAGDSTRHNFSTELYLAAGSYIEIRGYQSSGVSLNLGGTTSFATMSYMGS